MKSYTDLPQSKELAEILPIESADMHYHYDFDFDELESIPTITEEDDHFILFPKDVRCWSLAALLNILTSIDAEQVRLVGFKNYWYCEPIFSDVNHYIGFIDSDNPVDACYEMIIKLKENNLL